MVLYVPAAVPEAIRARLLAGLRSALQDPDLLRLLEGEGFVLVPPRDPGRRPGRASGSRRRAWRR